MATAHWAKLTDSSLAQPGEVQTFVWNGIPRGTAVHYWVEAKPKSATGPHGTSSGSVAILQIRSVYIRDNYNSDTSRVEIDIKNTGSSATYFTIYQGWMTGAAG